MSKSVSGFPYHMFEVYGLELEYMIVNKDSFDILPCADKILLDADGILQDELQFQDDFIDWSNELATHVLEFKVHKPVKSSENMENDFHRHVLRANRRLEAFGGVLMSGAVHPWMNPDKEFVIWPHANKEIYNKYDEIFGCKGHGWSNLQSAHINFPFKSDAEFRMLHAALRVLVALTPAITAASPYLDGKFTGKMDARMDIYRNNARRIPQMAGLVVPEVVSSQQEYEDIILNPLYAVLAPFDPEGVLKYEWANSRGCIARFDRGSIELRTLSTQESPVVDMAIADLIIQSAKKLSEEKWQSIEALNKVSTSDMHDIFLKIIELAEEAPVDNLDFLACFGLTAPCRAGDIWRHLYEISKSNISSTHYAALENIFAKGTLATRMLKDAGKSPSKEGLKKVAAKMVHCLAENKLY